MAFSKSKFDHSITQEEYDELYKRCSQKAHGQIFYADQNLIQAIVCRAIEQAIQRPNWRETYLEKTNGIHRLVIDAVRFELGDIRYAKNRVQQVTLDHNNRPEDSYTPPKVSFEEMLSDIPHREHAIMYLKFVWGMEHKEIAEVFRVDEARISQLISETLKHLRDQDA